MPNDKNTPSVAVVGTGYWGKNLVRNFHHLGALKLISDKSETVLAQFKKQYPGIDTCFAFQEILNRDDIDGVVIATPAETHYTLAGEALLAGKHVYVEKPMALLEAEGRELTEIAEDADRVLMVGHLLQHHPAFVKLKAMAANGDLGRINYIYSHRLNLGKIRREENILWSFAPHDISMILALAGEEPESVYASGGNYLHKKIADVTTTHLEFPSGLRAHIFVSWLHPFKEQKLVVVGDKKMAVFDDTRPWSEKLLLYPHEIKWQDNIPVPSKADPERLDIHQAEPLRIECGHFLNCISNGSQPLTDGNEGLRVLKILNASQKSLDQDGIKLQLLEQEPIGTADSVLDASNFTKISVNQRKSAANIEKDYFVHESVYIDEGVDIGSGTKIWHFSHILSNSKIGENGNIGQNVVIGPDVTVGDSCKIQNNVSIYPGVTLEDGVFCGPSMVFTNVYNPRAEIRKMDQARPTLVKKGATIGANATIVCGVTIGRYAFIGAGAMVNKNVADHSLVVGNPAKQIGWACACGERLTGSLECIACGRKYIQQKDGIKER